MSSSPATLPPIPPSVSDKLAELAEINADQITLSRLMNKYNVGSPHHLYQAFDDRTMTLRAQIHLDLLDAIRSQQ